MCARERLLLEVKDLRVQFQKDRSAGDQVKAVDGVDLAFYRGSTLCLVGERGCGKSAVCRAIAGTMRQQGQVISGRLAFSLKDRQVSLTDLNTGYSNLGGESNSEVRIAILGPESVPSLSVLNTIGSQMIQAIRQHRKINRQEARRRAVEILDKLGLSQPERLIKEYPFRLPVDTHLRVQLALALSCEPSLLIIDDPLETLDIFNQTQILDVISAAQQELGMAVLYTTRDLDLAARLSDDIAVMLQGKIVEVTSAQAIFTDPKHPYTRALLNANRSISGMEGGSEKSACLAGCQYYPYCPEAVPDCSRFEPFMVTIGERHDVRCLVYETLLSEPLEPCISESDIWQLERYLLQ